MERIATLPLTLDMIGQLAWEAELRDMRIGELIAEVIVAMVRKDLFLVVLSPRAPARASTLVPAEWCGGEIRQAF